MINSPQVTRILLVQDQALVGNQLDRFLRTDSSVQVDVVAGRVEALKALENRNYTVIVTDLDLSGGDGLELIRALCQCRAGIAVIALTASGVTAEAREAVRLGASDLLTKPIHPANFRMALKRALRERSLREEADSLRRLLPARWDFHNLLSKSPKIHALFELIDIIGNTALPVLIEGEAGTGKQQVARAIHEASIDRPGLFVAVNCEALPAALVEGELLGHGAGNGAAPRPGRIELAQRGTLFLGEIGSLASAAQAAVVRLLRENRFGRVGGGTVEADVRVIGASSKPLQRLVRQGYVMEELYHHLAGLHMELPPLRQRAEDILFLTNCFVEKHAPRGGPIPRIDPAAMQRLLAYRWPGNTRELEGVIERACALARNGQIDEIDLPPQLASSAPERAGCHVTLDRPLPQLVREATASIERQYLRKALKKVHGNVVRAARICGLSRRSVTAKIAEYGINRLAFKEA